MNKLITWIEIICKYFICILMLLYGLVKVFKSQFFVNEFLKDVPLYKLSGTQLTWAFYDYHPAYQSIIGIIEVVVGLLVFFPRTTKLGIVLFLPVSFNIMLLNFMYGIAALPSSITLFIAGSLLMIIYFKSYWKYFFASPNAIINQSKFKKFVAPSLAIALGCGLAFVVIYHNHFSIQNDKNLKGKWDVVDDLSIKYVYFEKGNLLAVRTHQGNLFFGQYNSTNNNALIISSKNPAIDLGILSYRVMDDSLMILNGNNQQYILRRNQSFN